MIRKRYTAPTDIYLEVQKKSTIKLRAASLPPEIRKNNSQIKEKSVVDTANHSVGRFRGVRDL
jgi:hypothetical protein